MKTATISAILSVVSTTVLIGANTLPSTAELQGIQKNLARQHYSTNIFLFDPASQRFVPTEAAATWLDDDVTTAWSPLAGKQHYLVQFAEPKLINNFGLSGRDMSGTMTLFAGDSAAAPGDKTWAAIAKDIDYTSVNNGRLEKPLNKFAKYLLIETNFAEPKSIYSLYVYGETAAVNASIVQRSQPVDISTFGEFVNNQTAFNVAGIYAGGRVTFANSGNDSIAWQHAIDDNAQTTTDIAPSTTEAGAIVKFDVVRPISRLSIQSTPAAKGKLDVFLLSEAPDAGQTVNIEGVSPSVTFTFDGINERTSADIAETNSIAVAFRWTPDSGTSPIAIREFDAFSDLSLATHEIANPPVAVAESVAAIEAEDRAGDQAGDGKTLAPIGEGKETVDFKGGKEVLPPVAAGPPATGYRPGMIGFPPNTIVRPPGDPEFVSQ